MWVIWMVCDGPLRQKKKDVLRSTVSPSCKVHVCR